MAHPPTHASMATATTTTTTRLQLFVFASYRARKIFQMHQLFCRKEGEEDGAPAFVLDICLGNEMYLILRRKLR